MTRFCSARWFRASLTTLGLGALLLVRLNNGTAEAQNAAAAQQTPAAKAPAANSAKKQAAPTIVRSGGAAAAPAAPKIVLSAPAPAKRPTPAAPLPTPAATSSPKAAAATANTAPTEQSDPADATTLRPKLDKYTLRYKFQPGDVLKSKITQQTRVETTISGTTQGAEIATVSHKSWRVTKIDEQGNITFETQWDAIDMRQKMSGREEVRYNSATDKTAPPGYESTAAMIGIPLSLLTIDPRGKIISRESKNEQSEKLHENGTYLAKQQVLVPLPQEPVVLGQPWSTPTEIKVTIDETPRVIQARHRYQVDKIEGKVAVIAYETVLPPITDPQTRSQVIQQLGRGVIRFDMQIGRVLSQVTDVDERVLGFHGMNSSIHFLSRFTEELIPAEKTPTTAQAPTTAKATTKSPTATKAVTPTTKAVPKSVTPAPRPTTQAATPATKVPAATAATPTKPSTDQSTPQAKKK